MKLRRLLPGVAVGSPADKGQAGVKRLARLVQQGAVEELTVRRVRQGAGSLRAEDPGRCLGGPGAAQAAARVFRPKGTRALPDAPDRQLLYGTLLDQAGQALDTGLAFVSRAPHSYTGEETAELQCHGSPMVLSLIHISEPTRP